MPTQPSSTLRATMHTQKKRKNTSFRLQKELRSSLLSPISISTVYLFFSVSVSHFSPPPLTTAPAVSTRNLQAVHRQRSSPSVFLLLPFVYHLHLVHYIIFFFFILAVGFHRKLAVAAKVFPFLIFFPHL
ncbi:hypothetical protein FQN60_000761 [Etheostoma spectabile]|uniref:Transmembrane protein n=1 Tax=Etheostoma spectabile TaxID=54343 RepID=A0A5J5D2Z6_9PERO|nr:hypothetical protein FQN60_000761 [Etheostoma spectabile]